MKLSAKDWRHLLLISSILAILPVLLYPSTLGLGFTLPVMIYLVLELVYFFAIFKGLNSDLSSGVAVAGAFLTLMGRLLLSTLFMFLLAMLEPVGFAAAFRDAFAGYKPALLLFSLVAPVVYNSTFRIMLQPEKKRRPLVERRHRPATPLVRSDTIVTPQQKLNMAPEQKTTKPVEDYFSHTLGEAVKHIGDYSGVQSAMLIDQEGLPVAVWQRDSADAELWSALVVKIVDQLESTLAKAQPMSLDQVDFQTADLRFSIARVREMWLLAIADAHADDLEKIRLQQAVEMVERNLKENYGNVEITETERSYAGNAV